MCITAWATLSSPLHSAGALIAVYNNTFGFDIEGFFVKRYCFTAIAVKMQVRD